VSILQYRSDYGPRMLEISVKNAGHVDLTVTRAAFESPHFVTPAVWTRSTEVPTGVSRDLRVQLSQTDCSPKKTADVVMISWTLADGSTGTASVRPTDPFHSIASVTGQDCLEATTVEHVTVAMAKALRTETRGGELVAMLDVTFTAKDAAGSLTVDSVGATILLRPASGEAWPVNETFAAGSAPRTITLDFVPNNCRIHTVAEDKRGTFFPITVTTAGGVTGEWYLASSDAMRESIYAYVASYCGW
jgi:hypothetical protein